MIVLLAGTGRSAASEAPRVWDIRDFGAVSDEKTLCTAAIQKAIEQCAARGGGVVYFPPGTWPSGTIEMRSHVTLKLEAGSRLLGSPNPADYPEWGPRIRSYSNGYTRQSLIRGEDLEQVTICGRGTIDGQGASFFGKQFKNRPFGIRLVNCRDVLVEDVSMRDSAMWMQQYLACQRVRIRSVAVTNHVNHNNDGLDLDGCRDVVVSDCFIDSEDDAICLKSTCDRMCENITVTNCVLRSYCSAIKTGTESNGGFRNIVVANCTIASPPPGTNRVYGIRRCQTGISLGLVDGGLLENVTVSNIAIDGVETPIFVRLGNRARPIAADMPKPGVGRVRNVALSGIVACHASKRGCSITGIPGHPIENVQLSNIQIATEGGGTRENANRKVPELENAYPDSTTFKTLPSYGFFCRHVVGLKLRDIRLTAERPDLRPAIIAEDVKQLVLDGLEVSASAGAAPMIRLIDCPKAVVRNSGDVFVDNQPVP
jgi:polygalacturonase